MFDRLRTTSAAALVTWRGAIAGMVLLASGCGALPAPSPSSASTASSRESPSASSFEAPGDGLSRAEAIAIANEARPRFWRVDQARLGTAGELINPDDLPFVDVDIPADRRIWLISVSDGGPPLGAHGALIVIVAETGVVLGVFEWIS